MLQRACRSCHLLVVSRGLHIAFPFRPTRLSPRALSSISAATAAALTSTTSATAPPQLRSTSVSRDGRGGALVFVRFSDGTACRFHGVWLRDHCPCAQCRHPLTQQRLHATHLIPVDLAPSSVGVDAEGRVTVAWPALPAPSGGALASEAAASVPTTHESVFDAAWLRAHAYWRVDGGADGGAPPALISGAPDAALDFSRVSPWRGDAWGARGTPRAFPSVSHDEWMRSDAAVLRGLRALRDVGFVCVEGVPATEAATGAAASRVCMMRETVYGAGVWRTEVRVDPRAVQDTAYTRLPLPAHTDGCYWADPPGVQAFHALRADDAGGGGSLLVDGFAVADAVARDDPAAFALLCAWPLPYHHSEQRGATLRAERPVFRCDASGRVVGVAFNNDDREPLRLPFGSGDAAGGATRAAAARLDLPPTGARLDIAPRLGNPAVAVPAMYAALAAFQRALRDTSLHLWMTLRPGRLLLFNNVRLGWGGVRRVAALCVSRCILARAPTLAHMPTRRNGCSTGAQQSHPTRSACLQGATWVQRTLQHGCASSPLLSSVVVAVAARRVTAGETPRGSNSVTLGGALWHSQASVAPTAPAPSSQCCTIRVASLLRLTLSSSQTKCPSAPTPRQTP